MQKAKLIAALSLCVLAAPAWAINKCKGADGKWVFQDGPCAGTGTTVDVRPASGRAARVPVVAEAASGVASAAKPMTEAERINAATAASAKRRRMFELNDIVVPKARARMYGHREECRQRQQALRDRQYDYVQNLYGKTHAAQIASEISALAAQCDIKDRELTAEFNRLLQECKGLDACKDIQP